MVFPSISDPLTTCFYTPTQSNLNSAFINIKASTATMAKLSDLNSIIISVTSLNPLRRFLTNTVAGYSIHSEIFVNISKSFIKQVVSVISPNRANSSSDFTLLYKITEKIGDVSSALWTITECRDSNNAPLVS